MLYYFSRNNCRENAIIRKQPFYPHKQITERKTVRMSRHRPLTVRIFQAIYKERRIAYYRIKYTGRLQTFSSSRSLSSFRSSPEILQPATYDFHPIAKRTCHHILPRLSASISIHINPHDLSFRKTLRHHERNQTRSGTDVQNPPATLRPGTQQNAVSTHFHGTTVLLYFKLFKSKITHKFFCFFTEENESAANLFYRKQQKMPFPPAKADAYIYKNGYLYIEKALL